MRKSKYAKVEIKFIMNLKKRGATYQEIATEFGKKFGIKKTKDAIRDVYSRFKGDYDMEGLKSLVEMKAEVVKVRVEKEFIRQVEQGHFVPTQAEFCRNSDFNDNQIRSYFGSFDDLEQLIRDNYPKTFKRVFDPCSFTAEALNKLRKDISGHKRFIITTAVTGVAPHEGALNAIKTFCKKRNAKLLTLVCSDPARTREHKYKNSIHHLIPQESIVFANLSLNSNLFLSTIKTSAKQINPLTGLKGLAQNKASFIFASPKQDIEHLTDKNKKTIPKAVMTTGAVTLPDYNTEMYMSERTATIAEEKHKMGAIVVEIKNNKVFFYRPVQFDSRTGAFTDLDTQYFADGTTKKVRADVVQFGDYHVLSHDPKAVAGGKALVDLTKPEYLTVEDFFDGITINPHEKHNIVSQAKKTLKGKFTLKDELEACRDEINKILSWKSVNKLIVKYGNHEDFLARYLNSAEYATDKVNHYEGVCLAKAMIEGEMPFEHAMRERYPINKQNDIVFLGVDDSLIINGIENGAHGHLGANGKRNPTLVGLSNCYGKCNTGHNHSGAVYKDVFRAGTKTYRQVGYNHGPSAWTHSDVLQHKDGSRQLITYIEGEFTIKD